MARRTHILPVAEADLETIVLMEEISHSHPWTLGQFRDSLQAGHAFWGCWEEAKGMSSPCLKGYLVAMTIMEEVHLLNVAVHPKERGQGVAGSLIEHLIHWARQRQAQSLWLEVRLSNTPAQTLYQRYGFTQVGIRKNYYAWRLGQREDARVLMRPLLEESTEN